MSLSKRALVGLYLPILIATLATSLMLSVLLSNQLPAFLGALTIALATACASVALVHRRLIRPMAGFSTHLRQCADGQAHCPQGMETHQRHRFMGEIARSTQDYITHFHDLGRNLSQCGGNISIAAAEVSHFIDQLKQKIEGDVREITEIAASANQMAQTSSQAADSADEAATAATETRDESQQGLTKVHGAIQQVHGVSESVVQTSSLVGKLRQPYPADPVTDLQTGHGRGNARPLRTHLRQRPALGRIPHRLFEQVLNEAAATQAGSALK